MSGTHNDTFGITAADVDALIDDIRAEGGDIQELEFTKRALCGPEEGQADSAEARGGKAKGLIAMLRHGGEALAKWLGRLSPKAAGHVSRYAKKLADLLETAENRVAAPIIAFLMAHGVPHTEAAAIAGLIVLFIGWAPVGVAWGRTPVSCPTHRRCQIVRFTMKLLAALVAAITLPWGAPSPAAASPHALCPPSASRTGQYELLHDFASMSEPKCCTEGKNRVKSGKWSEYYCIHDSGMPSATRDNSYVYYLYLKR